MGIEQRSGRPATLSHPDGLTSPGRRLLGDLLIAEGLITELQLREALRIQRGPEPLKPVGQILVERRVITQNQLDTVLDKYQKKKYRLGDILVETGVITEDQLEIALQHQKRTGLRLGYVLLKLNFITEEQMKQALCQQLNVTFVDLDKLVVDRSLTHLISRDYAQRHRVIPVSLVAGRLTVAMEDPTDAALVEELRSLTGYRLDVLMSTHAAFQRAFARIYEEGAEIGLAGQYEQTRRAHEHLSQEHQANVQALMELRGAYAALRRAHEVSANALRELEERHDALRRTQQCAAEELEKLLRRLRSLPELRSEPPTERAVG